MTRKLFELPAKKPRVYKLLSFSAIDQFSNCERRYFLERIMGRRSPDTAITLVGRTYHEAIAMMVGSRVERAEEWADHCAAKAIKDNHDALTKLGVRCGSLVPEMQSNLRRLRVEVLERCGLRCAEQIVPYSKRGMWLERAFYDYALGYKGVVDVLSLRAPLCASDGEVEGGADEVCCFDWKSVTSDRRRSQRDAETSAQLALYALASGAKTACFVEIPRNLERPLKTRVVRYTDNQLRDWAQWLVATRAAVLSRGRSPFRYRRADRKNPLCSPSWCPHYLESCYPETDPLTAAPVVATV